MRDLTDSEGQKMDKLYMLSVLYTYSNTVGEYRTTIGGRTLTGDKDGDSGEGDSGDGGGGGRYTVTLVGEEGEGATVKGGVATTSKVSTEEILGEYLRISDRGRIWGTSVNSEGISIEIYKISDNAVTDDTDDVCDKLRDTGSQKYAFRQYTGGY